MGTLIVRSDKKKLKAVKELLRKMEIPFETTTDRIYNEAFEAKLKRSDDSVSNGKYQALLDKSLDAIK